MKLGGLLLSLAMVAGVVIATQGCALVDDTDSTTEDKLCAPGAYVFCRCADRTPGTKLCKADARSFEPCATSSDGECVGGEIDDPRTNMPVDQEELPPDGPDAPDAIEGCPGRSTALKPGVALEVEGDTTTATGDRNGKERGACAVGAGANDHVYRLIPSGTGSLNVTVKGSDGLDPVVYVRSSCEDEASQASCGPPSKQKVAKLRVNVATGREYFLVIDGASSTRGKYVATLELTSRSFCGDGKVDPGEACDDGNNKVEAANEAADGCSNDCKKVNGDPPSGDACPGHPVHLWPGQNVTGIGSTDKYGNSWGAPSQACDPEGKNTYADHIYEVTPHATGELVVTLDAAPGKSLPNLMLTARTTCEAAASAPNMCENEAGAGGAETMRIPVSNSKKVYVAVDGGGAINNTGSYEINFTLMTK